MFVCLFVLFYRPKLTSADVKPDYNQSEEALLAAIESDFCDGQSVMLDWIDNWMFDEGSLRSVVYRFFFRGFFLLLYFHFIYSYGEIANLPVFLSEICAIVLKLSQIEKKISCIC